jgi:hypothetical protein
MKTAFLKRPTDFRTYDRNIEFSEIEKWGNDIYDNLKDASYIGYILALKCDLFLYTPDLDNSLLNYDVILSITPILKKRLKDEQLLCYIEPEPIELSFNEHRVWSKDQPPEYPYDLLLDNFYDIHTAGHISSPYAFDLAYFEQLKQPKKEGRVFVQKRTSISGFQDIYTENWGERSYPQFVKDLSTCEYAINLCENGSSGQIIAECSLLDVICFARPHKIYTKILLSEFCHISNEQEFYEKINILKNDSSLKVSILQDIKNNCKKIDINNFRALIEEAFLEHQNKAEIL